MTEFETTQNLTEAVSLAVTETVGCGSPTVGFIIYGIIGVIVAFVFGVILMRHDGSASYDDDTPIFMVMVAIMWPLAICLGLIAGLGCSVVWCARATVEWLDEREETQKEKRRRNRGG